MSKKGGYNPVIRPNNLYGRDAYFHIYSIDALWEESKSSVSLVLKFCEADNND